MKIDSLMLNLPVVLQNAAISIYGYTLQRNRYSGLYSSLKQAAFERLRYERQRLAAYQERQFIDIVKNACKNVPYYAGKFKACGIEPGDIDGLSVLQKLPMLEKGTLRSDPESLIDSRHARRSLQVIHTTGSTGTPLNIYCDESVRQNNYAFYDRFLEINGISSRGKRATFGGRIVVRATQKKPPYWRYSLFQRNMLFSSYHLAEKNLILYIEALRKYKPDVIDSYPSSLSVLAGYAKRQGLGLKNITKAITTSAETLSQEQRATITEMFGVPVFDQYGAAEMCVFAGQCNCGNYHIHSDYGLVEFVKPDGSHGKPGDECELVCTGFINPVMPLIRYRVGDVGVLSAQECPCGLPFPVMEKILGRKDDSIITPDGRIVGRLSPVLKGFPIKEAQYIQEVRESLSVLIVKDVGFTKETEESCLKALRERVGPSISVVFKYVDVIERGAGGKLRSVISRVPR